MCYTVVREKPRPEGILVVGGEAISVPRVRVALTLPLPPTWLSVVKLTWLSVVKLSGPFTNVLISACASDGMRCSAPSQICMKCSWSSDVCYNVVREALTCMKCSWSSGRREKAKSCGTPAVQSG